MDREARQIIDSYPTQIGELVDLVAYKFDVDRSNGWAVGNEEWEEKVIDLATIALFSWEQFSQQQPNKTLEIFDKGGDGGQLFSLEYLVNCQNELEEPSNIPLRKYLLSLPYFQVSSPMYNNETREYHNRLARNLWTEEMVEGVFKDWLAQLLVSAKKSQLEQLIPTGATEETLIGPTTLRRL